MTKSAILDMNFWFHKGAKESPEVYDMMSTSSDGSYGFVMWDEWEEDSFLPNLFSPHSIFKLLFKDAVMLPPWAYNFNQEDIFISITDSQGNLINAKTTLDPETGDIIIVSEIPFTGGLLLVGKGFSIDLPQFYVQPISEWQEQDGTYSIIIPQTEHGFTGSNIIESIRTSDGSIVDVHMSVDPSLTVTLNSNSPFEGRLSLIGDVNQPNLYTTTINVDSWIEQDDYFTFNIESSDHGLTSPVQDLIVRTKDEEGNTIDAGIRIDLISGRITVSSNYRIVMKVLVFDEANFYETAIHDDIWLTDEEPYKIVIPQDSHGLFNIPNKINHHIKQISLNETTYLPTRLNILLDTYYSINGLSLVVDDEENVYPSILIDPEREEVLLQMLSMAKDHLYGDLDKYDLEQVRTVFMPYYDDYDNLTPLMKSMVLEMYYLHHNEDDGFVLLNKAIDDMQSYGEQTMDKPYYLTVVLYTYMVINKIMKKRITDNTSFEYAPDYWDNK